jgi:hypothetical protein
LGPILKDIVSFVIKDGTKLGFSAISTHIANPPPRDGHLKMYEDYLKALREEAMQEEERRAAGERAEEEKKAQIGDSEAVNSILPILEACNWNPDCLKRVAELAREQAEQGKKLTIEELTEEARKLTQEENSK